MANDSQIPNGLIIKDLPGNWLSNGHLEVCLLKLKTLEGNQARYDESRPENLAILSNLVKPKTSQGNSLLEQEVSGKPVIIVAPELSFGSPDIDEINSLIDQYNQNLILICGFGFTKGSDLLELEKSDNVEGIWETLPHCQKIYNCCWIWIKDGKNVQHYIFLKNYIEQSGELSIPNLGQGDQILRLEGNDLIIFPTICADLISSEPSSPRIRITSSLETDCSANKKTLITGSLANEKSSSGCISPATFGVNILPLVQRQMVNQ